MKKLFKLFGIERPAMPDYLPPGATGWRWAFWSEEWIPTGMRFTL
jgi:hypothetical protein